MTTKPAGASPVDRGVRRHTQKWRTADGDTCQLVKARGPVTVVVRMEGYVTPGSVACELTDSGNGYIARFPGVSSVEQDYYLCMDYAQARALVLALSPHAKDLGFAA